MTLVILVDSQDNPIGTMEKLKAHQQGLLHRAFSTFVFRRNQQKIEILLQQRQLSKYHCGGLWTNTCCSHPFPDEDLITAGQRRLQQELGFCVPLTEIGCFTYHSQFDNGLIEHEVDHILLGEYDNSLSIAPNENEVMAYCWLTFDDIDDKYQQQPQQFTPWFKSALQFVKEHFA